MREYTEAESWFDKDKDVQAKRVVQMVRWQGCKKEEERFKRAGKGTDLTLLVPTCLNG